jgi:hypothetical protein
MKITKRQLKQIIKEELSRDLRESEIDRDESGQFPDESGDIPTPKSAAIVDILDSDSMYDLLIDAVEAHLTRNNRSRLGQQEVEMMRNALQSAVSNLEDDYS